MSVFVLKAVLGQNPDSTTRVINAWQFNAPDLKTVQTIADTTDRGWIWEIADMFEICDVQGNLLSTRLFRAEGENAPWS